MNEPKFPETTTSGPAEAKRAVTKRVWVLGAVAVFAMVVVALAVRRGTDGDEGDAREVAAPAQQPEPDGVFPLRAAFFSVRYPDAWSRRGDASSSPLTPTLGYYNSLEPAVVDEQLAWAAQAQVDVFVVPWSTRNDVTDRNLRAIIDHAAARGPRWALYYQPEGRGNPMPHEILDDLRYLEERYFSAPHYLTVDGGPVVFVYAREDGGEMVDRWLTAEREYGSPLFLVLKVFSGFREQAPQPDSWHQFDPAVPYAEHLPYTAYVSPGYAVPGEEPRLARDPARFETDVERLVASGADWQLIETWNDWGEGTSVEPTEQYGTTYIDVLARHPTR